MFDHVTDLVHTAVRTDRHDHRTDLDRAEPDGEEFDTVGKHDENPVTPADAVGVKCHRGMTSESTGRCVGQCHDVVAEVERQKWAIRS